MDWLRQMIRLPKKFSGVIEDTTATATLTALLTAREAATDYSANEKGFYNKLRVYASTEAHSSIEKGVKIADYGKENLKYIFTNKNYAMLPCELEKAIKENI